MDGKPDNATDQIDSAEAGPDNSPRGDGPPATGRRGPGGRTHPAVTHGGMLGLMVGALGVVFGDIGTSPLYSLQTVFTDDNGAIKPDRGDVFGVISLVFWTLTIIVSIKYVAFMLRADNDGEGGIMALAAFARKHTRDKRRLGAAALLLGVLGAALFYGDSLITPAISVLSSVEGLEVVSSSLSDVVLPISIAILVVLFVVQRFGTHVVGRMFGPVMVLWFMVLALLGIVEIVKQPGILQALLPIYIFTFIADHPYLTFIALSAIVLAITGAEALYADMGHFGKSPIRRSWFMLVFPCLVLNYLGQGALVLHDPKTISNPFYLLAPSWSRVPMVVLATLATVIASQAVISGAYSVSRQAARLGYLPNLSIRHTSTRESGQIYVPAVNWLLFGGVLVLILLFQSSARLANAYGLAVTGTFILTTTLFLVVAANVWHWAKWKLVLAGVFFGGLELAYFAANTVKIPKGGWLPLLIAIVIVTVMTTWQSGRVIVTARRRQMEGPLQAFVDKLRDAELTRVPGTAVFPHPSKETTPLALRANVEHNHVLHEHVILVSVRSANIPYVSPQDAITVDELIHSDDGVVYLDILFGFQDDQDIPAMLRHAVGASPDLRFDPSDASYFLSKLSLHRSRQPVDGRTMAQWRQRLFIALAHNAANPADSFGLPDDRTVVMGGHLEL